MEILTVDGFFGCCFLASAICSFSATLKDGQPIPPLSTLVGSLLFHGSVGGALGLIAEVGICLKRPLAFAVSIGYGAGLIGAETFFTSLPNALAKWVDKDRKLIEKVNGQTPKQGDK